MGRIRNLEIIGGEMFSFEISSIIVFVCGLVKFWCEHKIEVMIHRHIEIWKLGKERT